jgi:hypothetical protein
MLSVLFLLQSQRTVDPLLQLLAGLRQLSGDTTTVKLDGIGAMELQSVRSTAILTLHKLQEAQVTREQ